MRALAQRMLRKRSRDELLEGAYNKYAFHDAGLPRWFAEDQRRHARCALLLSSPHDRENQGLVVSQRPGRVEGPAPLGLVRQP